LDRQLWKIQKSPTKTWRSPARFSSLTAKEINACDADIVNLHWVTDGFLSIEEIGKIEKPIVWSLYDMWPFTGTEHYATDTEDARWRTGYTNANRPGDERGIDIDRWTWQRKKAHWTTPMHIVSASTWLQNRAGSSALMSNWLHYRIPHIVDCDVFAPMPKDEARQRLGITTEAPIVLFLASAGIHDRRKGWDLLDEALHTVREAHPDLEVMIVGPPEPNYEPRSGVELHWYGMATSNAELALLYNAADVTAVPSREDNMPLTAMESQTCGRPVVAFNIGGLPDIIEDQGSGSLVGSGSTSSLAAAIMAVVEDSRQSNCYGNRARERALAAWSPTVVVKHYEMLLEQVLSRIA
jgi:glycosyltransferase involved in cell wall biosynthesis